MDEVGIGNVSIEIRLEGLTEEDIKHIDKVIFKVYKPDNTYELINDVRLDGNLAKFTYSVKEEGYYGIAGRIYFKNNDFTTSISTYTFKAKDTFK